MRIRKVSPEIPLSGNVENTYGNSQVDAYAQEYQNEHNVIVSADTPTTSERVWFKKGKNLFGNYGTLNGVFINSTASKTDSNANATSVYIQIEPNTTYTISKTKGNRFAIGFTETLPNNNTTLTGIEDDRTATSLTSTSASNSHFLVIYISLSDSETFANIVATIQVEKGSTATAYKPYVTPSIYVDGREMYSTKNKTNCVKIWEGTAYQTNDTMLLSEPLEVGKMYIFKFLGNSSYYHNYDYFIYQNDPTSNTNAVQINYYSYPDTVGFRYRLSYQTSLQTLIINEATNGATNRAIKAIFKVN